MIADIFTLTDFEKVVKMEKQFWDIHISLSDKEFDRVYLALRAMASRSEDFDLIRKIDDAWNHRSKSVER